MVGIITNDITGLKVSTCFILYYKLNINWEEVLTMGYFDNLNNIFLK
jgi:hypothetical protein